MQRIQSMQTNPTALFDELDAIVAPVWDAKANTTEEKASVTVGSSRTQPPPERESWQRERAGSDQIFAEFLADL